MRQFIKVALIGLFLLCTSISYAAPAKYIVVIDAGSSGSRVHIYQALAPSSNKPHYYDDRFQNITEIVEKQSVKPGLSSFIGDEHGGSEAARSLRPLVDYAKEAIKSYGGSPKDTPLYIFATAGMRLLTEKEQTYIYDHVFSYFINPQHSPFKIKRDDVRTITGAEEGINGIVVANYLAGTWQAHTTPYAFLEMGGASLQVATATSSKNQLKSSSKNSHDTQDATLAGQNYSLESTSYLGLGINEIMESVASANCYPEGYIINDNQTGHFDYAKCRKAITEYLDKQNISEQRPSFAKNQAFYAVSNFYYTYEFFDVLDSPTLKNLKQATQATCKKSWSTLSLQYDSAYLHSRCFAGVYIDAFLKDYLQLNDHDNTIKTAKKIDGINIDWPMGFAILTT